MAIIDPAVRHIVICDDVTFDPNDSRRVTFEGLHSTIEADPASFPLIMPKLSVYLRFAGGRGTSAVRLVVQEDTTGQAIFAGAKHAIENPANPLAASSMIMRIRRSVFPRPGLYWIQFLHDDRVLSERPFVVTCESGSNQHDESFLTVEIDPNNFFESEAITDPTELAKIGRKHNEARVEQIVFLGMFESDAITDPVELAQFHRKSETKTN